MSWFRTAFNICLPDVKAYYTALDPVEFYEWRFTDIAPKGHLFTRNLPPSDIFTQGKVIASAVIDSNIKPNESGGYILTEKSPVDIILKIGTMPSPRDLIDKYNIMIKTRDKGIEAFKEDLLIRLYIDSKTDNPHLFRLSHYTDKDVTMHDFGSIKNLIEQFSIVRQNLIKKSIDKKYRAHEMEDFRRFENAMTFTNNSHLYVDSSKLDRLIETSGVKSLRTKTLPWTEFYLDISPDAKKITDKIKYFEDKTWVKSVLAH